MLDINGVNKEKIDYLLNNNPIPLSNISVDNEEVINYITSLLPYSTGFEIECSINEKFDTKILNVEFSKIPFILEVIIDSCEQRFRIPNGIKGFLCLYLISQNLCKYSELNPLSGIHYHVDFNDNTSNLYKQCRTLDLNFKENILKELDTWNYIGTYNDRNISFGAHWIKLNSEFQTLEFRIGEMTFDYKLLIKRILHCNKLVGDIKKELNGNYAPSVDTFTIEDKIKLIKYFKELRLDNRTLDFNRNVNNQIDKIKQDLNVKQTKESIYNSSSNVPKLTVIRETKI
jgi:hypothetical protein